MNKKTGKQKVENTSIPERVELQKKADQFFSIQNHSVRTWLVPFALLAVSLSVLIYYITGPALSYFHADCTDSLLWSQVMVETGKILSEDFHYAALLPFGSPLWMVPILWIFGYTMTAQTISMCVFAVIFVFAAFSMFRAMKWNNVASAGGALLLSLLLSGSVKLREIMWEHVIYYSLGILLFMLLLNLCLRVCEFIKRLAAGERGRGFFVRFGLLAGALLILCIGCGMDGFQMLVLSVVPVLGGYVAMLFFEEQPQTKRHIVIAKWLLAFLMAVGAVLGLAVLLFLTKNGAISAGYEDGYSNWSPMSEWWGHIEGFLLQYLKLFGVDVQGEEALFSVSSVFVMMQLFISLLVLVCPLFLLLRYRRLQRESAKLIAWAHCIVSAVIGLGYVCGALSTASWRLTPLLGSCIIATEVYLRELWDDKAFGRKMAGVLLLILCITAGFHAYTIACLPNTAGENQKYISVAEMLAEKGYTKGYATFWNAGNTTLLSDRKVMVVTVNADENGISKRNYQTRDPWFESEEGREAYFLMLSKHEYLEVRSSGYWKTLNDTYELLDNLQYEGFHILVFSGNPILE